MLSIEIIIYRRFIIISNKKILKSASDAGGNVFSGYRAAGIGQCRLAGIFKCSAEICGFLLGQKFPDQFFHLGHIGRRFKTGNDFAGTADDEFGEIPFDVIILFIAGIDFGKMAAQNIRHFSFAEAFETLLRFQKGIQGKLILSVHLGFFHPGKGRAETGRAEIPDLFIAPRRLAAELVARNVDDLQSPVMIFAV